MADHIRAMQVYVVSKKIDEVRRRSSSGGRDDHHYPYPFMLCGDLNSDPLSGASQLLSTRSLAPDQHDCWKYLNKYRWDVDDSDVDEMVGHGNTGEQRRIENHDEEHDKIIRTTTESSDAPPLIELPGSFPILQSGCREIPAFTNFALDFVDTLDYVLASQASSESELYGFQPKRSAPMPSIKDVEEFVAMVRKKSPFMV